MKKTFDARRRALMLAGAAAGLAPAALHSPRARAAAFDARVTLSLATPGHAANALLAGNNVQWIDGGDGLLQPNSLQFSEPMLAQARALAPTVLRYPGGSLTDTYHWRTGIGELAQRKQSMNFYNRTMQTVRMGTQEMLELCEATGAVPHFCANTATDTAQDAAEWVAYVNRGALKSRRTGNALPRVPVWEIGNEPYLQEEQQKELWIQPEEFARRATQWIVAMKAADPAIKVGIPLRSDQIGGLYATPYQGYNDKVLRGVATDLDFVALHSSYLPIAYDRQYPDTDLYYATMAATQVTAADFSATRTQLATLRPRQPISLTVTEHNALFTLGVGRTDGYIATLAGALYVADTMSLFASTPDLAIANFWSLCGNWFFGALDQAAVPRPAFHVLQSFRNLLRGRMIPAAVQGRTFRSGRVGYVPAYAATPSLRAVAALESKVLRIALINKDALDAATVQLAFPGGGRPARASLATLTSPGIFDAKPVMRVQAASAVTLGADSARLSLPAHSFAYLELTLP